MFTVSYGARRHPRNNRWEALNSTDTGEPVLSGSILSNHSVLSGRFSKFRHFYPVITVISSPLNGHLNDAVVVTFSLQRPIVIALHICRTFT